MRAAHDYNRASHKFFGDEWNREDVIHTTLERLELRPEVAPSRENNDWHSLGSRPALFQPVYKFRLCDVHIDNGELRLPLFQYRNCLLCVGCNACEAGSMVESQLNDACQHRLIDDDQSARGDGRLAQGFHCLSLLTGKLL
jgi:hypothetical protein